MSGRRAKFGLLRGGSCNAAVPGVILFSQRTKGFSYAPRLKIRTTNVTRRLHISNEEYCTMRQNTNAIIPTMARQHWRATFAAMANVFAHTNINPRDARIWQIVSLSLLLTFGLLKLGFDQQLTSVVLILGVALATQYISGKIVGLPRFDPMSPLITGLSLSILLRAADPLWLMAGAVLAIGSKFIIRYDGKHIFNPANFALGALILGGGAAWISPAQWGSATWAAFLFLSLAILVLSRAKRADIAIAFLLAYIGILFARAIYLGDPLSIPIKQMQSGALLLFAFFMISDPKTTPDTRAMRIVFAGLVAMLAAYINFILWRPEGLVFALFLLSPIVPLLDRLSQGQRLAERFQWSKPVVN
jgi:enediyne biosynthesis protein E5